MRSSTRRLTTLTIGAATGLSLVLTACGAPTESSTNSAVVKADKAEAPEIIKAASGKQQYSAEGDCDLPEPLSARVAVSLRGEQGHPRIEISWSKARSAGALAYVSKASVLLASAGAQQKPVQDGYPAFGKPEVSGPVGSMVVTLPRDSDKFRLGQISDTANLILTGTANGREVSSSCTLARWETPKLVDPRADDPSASRATEVRQAKSPAGTFVVLETYRQILPAEGNDRSQDCTIVATSVESTQTMHAYRVIINGQAQRSMETRPEFTFANEQHCINQGKPARPVKLAVEVYADGTSWKTPEITLRTPNYVAP